MNLYLRLLLNFKRLLGLKLSINDKYIFKSLKVNDIVIDCGANVGDVTELMAKNDATVYAFEPNPHAYKVLNKRFETKNNVICGMKAVGIKDHKAELFFHENSEDDDLYWSTGSSLLKCKPNVNSNRSVKTDVIDLANFIRNLGKDIKLIKIDIEGAECEVLDYMIDVGIIKNIEIILVEIHDHKITELIEPTSRLKNKIKNKNLNNIYLNWR